MLPDTVAAVAANAAVAVAEAAAAAAAQGRRPLCVRGPSFVDGTSYLAPEGPPGSRCEPARAHRHSSLVHVNADDEWQKTSTNKWCYLRLLSGHWSAWTVTALVLNGQRLHRTVCKEFQSCTSLSLLHLENCGIANTDFCSDLPNLRRLLLPHNELRSLHALKNLPRLEELCVKGNPIKTFRDLALLAGLPALRRLDLQALDGSEAAPVCRERGYRKAVMALLPRHTVRGGCGASLEGPPRGTPGCSTRLDILDGQRLHLPPLEVAANEAAAAAADTRAKTQLLRAAVEDAIDSMRQLHTAAATPSSCPHQSDATHTDPAAAGSAGAATGNSQQSEQQPQFQLLEPAEACRTFRDLLSSEVQEALSNAQQLIQLARRASAEAKRNAVALSGKPVESPRL